MGHRTVDALLLALAHENGMVLTSEVIDRAGVAWHLVRSREGTLLTRVGRSVYIVGPRDPAVLLRAALAAVPSAAVACRTAAPMHGLTTPTGPGSELVAARRTRLAIGGVRIRWTRWLPDDDVALRDGMRVTTAARTLCDLSAVVSRARLRHLVETAILDRQVTTTGFLACAAGWRRRGRPGSGSIRALEDVMFDDEPLTASELERRAVGLLDRSGLRGWVLQYAPPWYDGARGVVDLAWPEQQLVVELDGRRWHATTQALADDRRRDRLAAAHGWATLRFSWSEIVERPDMVVSEITDLLSVRHRVGGPGNGHRLGQLG